MKVKKGTQISCGCNRPMGSFVENVSDETPITGYDFSIIEPYGDTNSQMICKACHQAFAEIYSLENPRPNREHGYKISVGNAWIK